MSAIVEKNVPDLKINYPEEIAVKKPETWKGRHLFVTSNAKTLFITRIAAAVIVALGIALIAFLGTGAAIAGGVLLTVAGLGLLAYSFIDPPQRKKFEEDCYIAQLKKDFFCAGDLHDLPQISWRKSNNEIQLTLSAEHLAHEKIALAGAKIQDKTPFVVKIIKIDNERRIDLFSFGKPYNRLNFVVEGLDKKIALQKKEIVTTFGKAHFPE